MPGVSTLDGLRPPVPRPATGTAPPPGCAVAAFSTVAGSAAQHGAHCVAFEVSHGDAVDNDIGSKITSLQFGAVARNRSQVGDKLLRRC